MRSDALPQIDALADVKRQCVEAVEKVNTRRLRDGIKHIGSELRWNARPFARLNAGRYAAFRIDKRAPFAPMLALVDAENADFGDPVVGSSGSGGFQIDEGDGGREHHLDGRTIVR